MMTCVFITVAVTTDKMMALRRETLPDDNVEAVKKWMKKNNSKERCLWD